MRCAGAPSNAGQPLPAGAAVGSTRRAVRGGGRGEGRDGTQTRHGCVEHLSLLQLEQLQGRCGYGWGQVKLEASRPAWNHCPSDLRQKNPNRATSTDWRRKTHLFQSTVGWKGVKVTGCGRPGLKIHRNTIELQFN